jgi:multiple sugar transport system substrate-binding protein
MLSRKEAKRFACSVRDTRSGLDQGAEALGKHTVSRTSRIVAVVALASAALVACSVGDPPKTTNAGKGEGPVKDPTSPTTVTFSSWVGSDVTMKNLAADFHKEHPNITIQFQNVNAENASQKLTTQIAGGNPPDVAFVNASDTSDFASRQALVNLDDYIERSDVVDPDDYVDAFKTFVTYDGSMWGLPIDGESTGLFYRTDLFEAAGITAPPTTWEEFEADAAKLTDTSKKQYGYEVFASEAAYYWYPWLYQAGGDLLSEDGKDVVFDSPEAKKAADFYVNLAKYSPPDYLNSNSYDGRVAFAQGQVAMYMAGSWFAGTLHSEFPKIDGKWDTAPLPDGPAGCKTTIAGDSLILLAGSKNPDAAWKWIEFLSQPENLATWTYKSENGTTLPPLKSLLESPDLVQTKPVLEGFAKLMQCGVASTVANPKFPKIEEQLNIELGKAFYGEQSAEQALDNSKQKAEQILSH